MATDQLPQLPEATRHEPIYQDPEKHQLRIGGIVVGLRPLYTAEEATTYADARVAHALAADRARAVPVAWMDPSDPDAEPMSNARKHSSANYNGLPGKAIANRFSRPLYTRPPAPEQPADLSIQAAGEREAFEQFFADSRRGKGQAALSKLLERMPGGDYVQDHTQRHWWTWQKARASLSTPASGEGWMPIETAPKDESVIQLGNADGAWIGFWRPVAASGYRFKFPWQSLMLNHNYMAATRSSVPTHWRQLPPAPTSPTEPAAEGGA